MNWFTLNSMALAVRADGTYAPFSGDALKFAGQMTLMGMGMIFAVLATLWGVLAIFKLVFAGRSPKAPKTPKQPKVKQTEPRAETAQSDDAVAAVIAAGIQAYQADTANDTALVAILTAAVAAHREAEGDASGFRVVSFKRSGARAWNARK